MATIEEFNRNIQRAINELIQTRPAEALKIGFDTKALVRLRVQQTGKKSDGAAFPKYTPAYEKYKKKIGRDVGFTNLTLTGRMFVNTLPEITENTRNATTVEIKGGNDFTRLKLAVNSARYKTNILEPNAEEEAEIFAAYEQRTARILRKYNLT